MGLFKKDTNSKKNRWPEGAIVYQIYPRSFMDANDDGVGDLAGITMRLDYLRALGVDAIWLSPFYPSPMVDFGYDISDYKNVDPVFGTLDDFKKLLKKAHEFNIKVIVDFVANHTSDQHEWFKQSRSSRDNPRSNWYVWHDGKTDSNGKRMPPNNWLSALNGESAWQWDETRGQYYLHSWHAKQPDLNWQNSQVRSAIKDVMRFWLDIGVDGFRADAIDWIAKDAEFHDDRPNPHYMHGRHSAYDSLLHDKSRGMPAEFAYLAELTAVFEEPKYKDRQLFMTAETYHERHNPVESYIAFYGGLNPKYIAPYNFEGLHLKWEASLWRDYLRAFHGGLKHISPDCIPSYAFGNHDNPRLITRLGEDRARAAALLQLTLPGMLFIYYGEEIGMLDVELPPEFKQDVYYTSRDPQRTPMQWSPSKNAGFSKADRTWLPVAHNFAERNVATERFKPESTFSLYRYLIQLRQASKALKHGDIQVINAGHPSVVGFMRTKDDESYVTLVNFSGRSAIFIPGATARQLVVSTHLKTKLTDLAEEPIELLPNEAALFLK